MPDIKITKNCYLPKENVKFYIAYDGRSIERQVKHLKEEGKVFDYTYGKKIATVIFLNSGELILTNTTLDTLNSRMNP